MLHSFIKWYISCIRKRSESVMSEQEGGSSRRSIEGEKISEQRKETAAEYHTTHEHSPKRTPAYSPAAIGTSSSFFQESPLESPLLQEQIQGRSTPRPFNPPLPVSPSSLILRKDSKKKSRYVVIQKSDIPYDSIHYL